jgi:hypothetical protein
MADGIQCKHCGYYETEHGHVSLKYMGIDENKIVKGRPMSIKDCPGFSPEDPELAKKLEEKNGRVIWDGD